MTDGVNTDGPRAERTPAHLVGRISTLLVEATGLLLELRKAVGMDRSAPIAPAPSSASTTSEMLASPSAGAASTGATQDTNARSPGRRATTGSEAAKAPTPARAVTEEHRHADERRASAPNPPGPTPESAPAPAERAARTWRHLGRQMTAAELAVLAGCTESAMLGRLRRMPPDEAVRVVPPRRGSRAARTDAGVAAPAPAFPRSVFDASIKQPPARPGAAPPALDPRAEPVIPADVKRTVAPPLPDRWAAVCPQPLFSGLKPGQYDDDPDRPIARAFGGRGDGTGR